jgi:site-specific DNA-cytosine methylase
VTAAVASQFRPGVGALPDLFGEIIVDLFAGGGGMSLGIEHATGRCVDEAVNHDVDAIWMHRINHPNTRHHRDSVWKLDPLEVSQGRPVGLLHGSPDCTHFSVARGGKPVKKEIRGLAWCVLRWTAKLLPRVLTMENVREFLTWCPLVQRRQGPNAYLWEITDDDRRETWHGDGPARRGCRQTLRPTAERDVVQATLHSDGCSHGAHGGGVDSGVHECGGRPRGRTVRSAGRSKRTNPTKLTITGPHADDGSARQWKAWLGALGYAVEPLLIPDRKRSGQTFQRWRQQLVDLGYKVEHQVLDAADYGAPTHRRRLFIVARRDGQPIRWPEKTHGKVESAFADESHDGSCAVSFVRGDRSARQYRTARSARIGRERRDPNVRRVGEDHGDRTARNGLKPFRAAAECIERYDNCRSIWDRPKPLADNTLRRIVRGLVKFNIESDDPFIVQVNHAGAEFRGQSLDKPFPTISAKHGFGLVVPNVAPHIIRCAHGETSKAGPRWGSGAHSILDPLGTVTGSNDYALASAFMAGTANTGTTGRAPYVWDIFEPLRTITSCNDKAVVTPFLYDNHRERAGQMPRVRGLDRPAGTVTTAGIGNLVVPYLYTNVIGQQAGQRLDGSLGTITTVHNKFQLVTPYLFEFANSTWGSGSRPIVAPMPTLTALPKGGSWNVVCPLMVKFYQSGIVKPLTLPVDTITGRDRFGVVSASLMANTTNNVGCSPFDPVGAITTANRHFLLSAWMVKHYGGNYEGAGIDVRSPIDTITAVDHHAVATAFITQMRGTNGYGAGGHGIGLYDTVPTLTSGSHLFLTTGVLYERRNQDLQGHTVGPRHGDQDRSGVQQSGERRTPPVGDARHASRVESTGCTLETATIFTPRELMGPSENPHINRGFWRVYDLLRRFLGASAPLPIVRKDGVEYLIYDIGMRMLTPRELLNAQFGPELAKDYVLTGSRESQVAKIGNSVPPLLGAAVVRANYTAEESGVAA